MVSPSPTSAQEMAEYLHISLQLPLDPSDGKGSAILNKHTLMQIAQIF
jgi:hypothetical protein